MYEIGQYTLFQNDNTSSQKQRPYGGTAVYSRIDYYPAYPFHCNRNGVEITVLRLMIAPHITITAIYCSPKVTIMQYWRAQKEVLTLSLTQNNVLIVDFNVNWLNTTDNLYIIFS